MLSITGSDIITPRPPVDRQIGVKALPWPKLRLQVVIVLVRDFRLDASKAIRKVLRQNNITIAYFSDYDRFPSNEYIQETLVETQTEGRS